MSLINESETGEAGTGNPTAFSQDIGFDIGGAVAMLHGGSRVARGGWNGKGMWLELQRPDKDSKMTLPYVYMRTAQGDFVPWLCSQTDLLAQDWYALFPEGDAS